MLEDGSRELGAITATLEALRGDIGEMKGKLDLISMQIPEHHARLADHDRQLGRLWEWKDGQGIRLASYIGAAGTLCGGIVWLVLR